MTIGESIRYHRKRLHLTQNQLAERLNVTAQAISRWENGTGLPDITMAVPLARALGTTTDELLRFGERRAYWERCWKDALQHTMGDPEQMLNIALEALREFPYDRFFLYRAALNLEWIAESTEDLTQSSECIGRAVAYARSAAEMAPDDRSMVEYYHELNEKVTYNDQGFCVLKSRWP